jgi:hypothetical protein
MADAALRISLREVTDGNRRQVELLCVTTEQEACVAGVAEAAAELP